MNVFPLTRSKAKSTLPPQQKDKETSFLYVDWTKMYKEDRFFGSVYYKLKGDKPYDSEETSDFSKKKCFSNALRHTLVVLGMH